MDKNGLEVPLHLSMDFFKKAIEVGFNYDQVNVSEVVFSPGCSRGDNFCSLLYRTKIRYSVNDTEKSVSLIVKCILTEGDYEIFKIMNVYEKEATMYSKIIPAIEGLMKSANISEQMSPRLIYAQEKPMGTLVIQDLNDLDFVMLDRNIGLDEKQTKMVLTKIGQFHAASMVFARDNVDVLSLYNKSTFHKDTDSITRDVMYRRNIKDIAEFVQKWDGFEDIAEKLFRVDMEFYERMDKCLYNGEPFKVLNHGDLWVNNCMFKNVDGHPVEMLLIDFQKSYYASPAYDLHYFLNTSVQLDVLISKRYTLLRTYFKALTSTLEALNYEKIPSWEEFKNDFRKKEFIGFWAFEAILPMHALDKKTVKDNVFSNFTDEVESRKQRQLFFTVPRFLNAMKYHLDRFDELGILD